MNMRLPTIFGRKGQSEPPEKVTLNDIHETVVNQRSGKLVVGLDHDRRPVTLDLADTPHVLIVAPTGVGSSSLIRSFAAQSAHQGDHVTIVDPRRAQHRWATGSLTVDLWRDRGQEISPGITALAEHVNERFEEGHEVEQRRVLMLDGSVILNKYLDSRARHALAELLMVGRAVGVHVVLATGAGISAGLEPDMREQFGAVVLARPTKVTWRAFTGPDQDDPPRTRTLGRVHVITGGEPVETQAAWVTPNEAQGLSVLRPLSYPLGS